MGAAPDGMDSMPEGIGAAPDGMATLATYLESKFDGIWMAFSSLFRVGFLMDRLLCISFFPKH